jgi:hypothetical protein
MKLVCKIAVLAALTSTAFAAAAQEALECKLDNLGRVLSGPPSCARQLPVYEDFVWTPDPGVSEATGTVISVRMPYLGDPVKGLIDEVTVLLEDGREITVTRYEEKDGYVQRGTIVRVKTTVSVEATPFSRSVKDDPADAATTPSAK